MKTIKEIPGTLIVMTLVFFLIISGSCSKKAEEPEPEPVIDSGTVADADGNLYKTIKLGEQWWMAENLRTAKFSDCSFIAHVTDSVHWSSLSSPAFCYYDNDPENKTIYGSLYNWYAVNSGKLAPEGWHIPDESEWATLMAYLGGENLAGGKMKSTGTIHNGSGLWFEPNTGATNSSRMSVHPGGLRFTNGYFYSISRYAFFWSATSNNDTSAWTHYFLFNNTCEGKFINNKTIGFSVRCVKNL